MEIARCESLVHMETADKEGAGEDRPVVTGSARRAYGFIAAAGPDGEGAHRRVPVRVDENRGVEGCKSPVDSSGGVGGYGTRARERGVQVVVEVEASCTGAKGRLAQIGAE